jgi:glutamate/aspartate transport system substrate-binding protein
MDFSLRVVRGVLMTACAMLAFEGEAATLEKIKARHSATIGYSKNQFPFSYPAAGGKPTGYMIELCRRVLETMAAEWRKEPLDLKFVPVELGNRMALVANGTVDMICGLSTANAARDGQVAFLLPTFVDNTKIVVLQSSGIPSLRGMAGKRLAVVTGSSNVQIAMAANKDGALKMTILPVKTGQDAMQMLDKGEVEGYISSDTLIHGVLQKTGRASAYRILPESLERRTRAIMVPREDPDFRNAANRALQKLAKSGEFEEIYRRWLESPLPPDGVNFQLEMDDAIRAWVKDAKLAPNTRRRQ